MQKLLQIVEIVQMILSGYRGNQQQPESNEDDPHHHPEPGTTGDCLGANGPQVPFINQVFCFNQVFRFVEMR